MSTIDTGPRIIKSGLVLDMDASYMRSYSPNVIPNPIDVFANIGSEIQACTISRDTTMTRQYNSIPMKMAITGNDAYAGKYGYLAANLAPALSGQTWTISVWAKATVATDGQLFIFGADTNGAVFVSPDYNAGGMSITTSWQRFSFSYTFTNANTRYIQFRLDGTNSGGSGITIWWDSLQVERASSATPFNPYYFGNTIWRDVSGNLRNATLTNGPLFNSTNKGVITFDGSDDYAGTGNVALSFNTFTMECMVKYNSVSGNQGLFTYNNTNFINLWKGNGVGMRWEVNSGGQAVTGTNDLTTGVWYHFTGVYDGAKGYLYRNGALETSATLSSHTSEAASFEIGRYAGAGNTNGTIAFARFYTRNLSPAEVATNYNVTKTKFGL